MVVFNTGIPRSLPQTHPVWAFGYAVVLQPLAVPHVVFAFVDEGSSFSLKSPQSRLVVLSFFIVRQTNDPKKFAPREGVLSHDHYGSLATVKP
jgi:hypothetical protein